MSMWSVPQYLPAGMRAFSEIQRLKSSLFSKPSISFSRLATSGSIMMVALEFRAGMTLQLQVYLLSHGAAGGCVQTVHEEPAAEHADHAFVRLVALLHVERCPDAPLFVLGGAHVVIDEVVALRAPEGHQRPCEAPADRHKSPRPADDRVGLVDRTEGRPNLARKADLYNLNGGETTIRKSHPFISRISPMSRPVGRELQLYAPIMNENVYTNLWRGPYYGFRHVIETFELTDRPRRLKPIDIYYHFYSGEKTASLRALKEVYDWTLEQEILPFLFMSEYAKRVLAYQQATVAPGSQRQFTLPGTR